MLHNVPLLYQCMTLGDMFLTGLGKGTVHAQLDPGLTRKLRISTVPSIMAVVSGRVTWFEGPVSVQRLRDFVRSVFPADLVTDVRNTCVLTKQNMC